VCGDRDMLLQAILNLLSNAIKYTPAGGRVVIDSGIDPVHQTVTLNVSDTGVGIPGEDLPHVWEKFYRVADHKKIAKGTGLGLNLVKHVVETVHQGKVAVRSEVGSGSTFSMSLPLLDSGSAPDSRGRLKGAMV
jgi:two-component system phosphate regulon sensor histidine kinase PhoR